MAKVVIGAEVKVDGLDKAGTSVGSFKKQLREATQDLVTMADKFGLNSTEAQNAAKKVAGLKDAIGDAKALSETFNPDKKFVALGGALQGVTAGFSVVTGLMGLLGSESKETEKLLLKVQAAMALQQGISGVFSAIDSFKLLGSTIVDVFNKLKAAIGSLGIGAIIVVIGALISKFSEIRSAISGVDQAQKNLNETQEDYRKGATSAIEQVNKVSTAFKLAKQGVISKEAALKTYNDTLGDSFGKTNNLATAEKNLTNKAQAYIKITGLKAQANALFALSAKQSADALLASANSEVSFFDRVRASAQAAIEMAGPKTEQKYLANIKKSNEDTIREAGERNAKLLQQQAESLLFQASIFSTTFGIVSEEQNKVNTENAANANKSANDANAAADKALSEEKRREEERQKLKLLRIKSQQDELKAIEDFGKELNKEQDAQEAANKIRQENNISNELKAKAQLAELSLLNDPNNIDSKVAKIQADLAVELSTLAEGDLQRQVLTKKSEDEITKIKKEANDNQLANDKILAEQKKELLAQTGQALTALSDVVGKETVAGKALAVAGALINTYQGIAAGVKLGYPAAIPAVILAAATGFAAVKNILKTKVPGKGNGGGGTVPSVQSVTAPLLPQAQTTTLNQNSINQIGNAANRAFVLESDVSGNQERIRRLNRAARIN